MKVALVFLLSAIISFAQGARTTLLRVGLPTTSVAKEAASTFERSLFEEDLQASFRDLFGSDESLSFSLSMSVPQTPVATTAPSTASVPTASPVQSVNGTESPTSTPTAAPTPNSTELSLETPPPTQVAAAFAVQQDKTGGDQSARSTLSGGQTAMVAVLAVAAIAVVAAALARKMQTKIVAEKGAASSGSASDGSTASPQSDVGSHMAPLTPIAEL